LSALLVLTAAALTVATLYIVERNLVGINDQLASINASLTEASNEIVARIAQLQAQVDSGDPVDSALLAEIGSRAASLADIVPNDPPAADAVDAAPESAPVEG